MLKECPICHAACGIRGSFHSQGTILETYCAGGHSKPFLYADIKQRERKVDPVEEMERMRLEEAELREIRKAAGRRGAAITATKIRRVNGRFVKVAHVPQG